MVLQAASIVFNDSASQFNKDLTDFLKRNLEKAIRNGGLSFQFKIAKPADLTQLRGMGVKRLPAMIIGKTPYVGVPEIIEEIRNRVKNSRQQAPEKSEEEIIRDFHMKALGNIKKDAEGKFQITDEPDGDNQPDLMSAFNREIARRGSAAGHSNGGNNGEGEIDDRPRRKTPAPARDQEQEMDDEERPQQQTTRRTHPGPPARMPQRPDNIDNPMMQDAFESLKRVGKHSTGEDMQDDAMMAALLSRMGGD
jgi:hypothetical protein